MTTAAQEILIAQLLGQQKHRLGAYTRIRISYSVQTTVITKGSRPS